MSTASNKGPTKRPSQLENGY